VGFLIIKELSSLPAMNQYWGGAIWVVLFDFTSEVQQCCGISWCTMVSPGQEMKLLDDTT